MLTNVLLIQLSLVFLVYLYLVHVFIKNENYCLHYIGALIKNHADFVSRTFVAQEKCDLFPNILRDSN